MAPKVVNGGTRFVSHPGCSWKKDREYLIGYPTTPVPVGLGASPSTAAPLPPPADGRGGKAPIRVSSVATPGRSTRRAIGRATLDAALLAKSTRYLSPNVPRKNNPPTYNPFRFTILRKAVSCNKQTGRLIKNGQFYSHAYV